LVTVSERISIDMCVGESVRWYVGVWRNTRMAHRI
jgi:hypothetical protein